MTESAIVQTQTLDSAAAGAAIAGQLADQMSTAPDALLLFASPCHDHRILIDAIVERCAPGALVGCSTAGEFINTHSLSSAVVAIGIASREMQFSTAIAHDVGGNRQAAALHLSESLSGASAEYPFRYGLLFTDALAGHTEDLLERVTRMAPGYQFVGGGAGDDDRFASSSVFRGSEIASNAAALLEIQSKKKIGIGVSHGWSCATPEMQVSQVSGNTIVAIDSRPAAEAYERFAKAIDQPFLRNDPLSFFLHYVLGVKTEQGYILRVPLTITGDGAIVCAAEVSAGATVCIMKTDSRSSVNAARIAANNAMDQLGGGSPALGLFFDCAATRLRMGLEFGRELEAVAHQLQGVEFGGCNTYGQIAQAEGQFSGFHNCTAVVCLLPV